MLTNSGLFTCPVSQSCQDISSHTNIKHIASVLCTTYRIHYYILIQFDKKLTMHANFFLFSLIEYFGKPNISYILWRRGHRRWGMARIPQKYRIFIKFTFHSSINLAVEKKITQERVHGKY